MATENTQPKPTIDWLTLESRLLADRELRSRFILDRQAVAKEQRLSPADLGLAEQIDTNQLEQQAKALIDKRYYEVAELIPLTIQGIGQHSRDLFDVYAQSNWPTGHQRHLTDALQFHTHLRSHRAPGLCRAEANRLRFILDERRCMCRLALDIPIHYHTYPGLELLWRRKGNLHRYVIRLALGKSVPLTPAPA